MTRPWSLVAAVALACALDVAHAQAATRGAVTLAATVVETFGTTFIVTDGTQRILVTPRQRATPPPPPGSRVLLHGIRDGNTFLADTFTIPTEATYPPDAPHDALPPILGGLGLLDPWRYEEDDGEASISAGLPDGSWIAVHLDRRGAIDEIETDAPGGIPRVLVARILPEPLIAQRLLRDALRIVSIEIDEEEIEVTIVAASGKRTEIVSDREGSIRDVDDDDDDDERSAGRLDPATLTRILASLGYRDARHVTTKGRVAEFHAVNPYGESVLLEVNRAGQVTRERMLWSEDR